VRPHGASPTPAAHEQLDHALPHRPIIAAPRPARVRSSSVPTAGLPKEDYRALEIGPRAAQSGRSRPLAFLVYSSSAKRPLRYSQRSSSTTGTCARREGPRASRLKERRRRPFGLGPNIVLLVVATRPKIVARQTTWRETTTTFGNELRHRGRCNRMSSGSYMPPPVRAVEIPSRSCTHPGCPCTRG